MAYSELNLPRGQVLLKLLPMLPSKEPTEPSCQRGTLITLRVGMKHERSV